MELLRCTCYVYEKTPLGEAVEISKTICLPNSEEPCLLGFGRIVQFKFWRGEGEPPTYEDIHRTSSVIDGGQFYQWLTMLINAYPQIQKVSLIGSRMKRTARPNSDWDVLVSLDETCYKNNKPLVFLGFERDMETQITYDLVLSSNASIDLWFLRPNGIVARNFKRSLKDSFFNIPGFKQEDKTQVCEWPEENACCMNIWRDLYQDVSNALLLYKRPEFFIRIRKE